MYVYAVPNAVIQFATSIEQRYSLATQIKAITFLTSFSLKTPYAFF